MGPRSEAMKSYEKFGPVRSAKRCSLVLSFRYWKPVQLQYKEQAEGTGFNHSLSEQHRELCGRATGR